MVGKRKDEGSEASAGEIIAEKRLRKASSKRKAVEADAADAEVVPKRNTRAANDDVPVSTSKSKKSVRTKAESDIEEPAVEKPTRRRASNKAVPPGEADLTTSSSSSVPDADQSTPIVSAVMDTIGAISTQKIATFRSTTSETVAVPYHEEYAIPS